MLMTFAKMMISHGTGPCRMGNGDVQESTRDGFSLSHDHANHSTQLALALAAVRPARTQTGRHDSITTSSTSQACHQCGHRTRVPHAYTHAYIHACTLALHSHSTVILTVSPVNVDLADSNSFKLVQSINPQDQRTIGFLSKLVLMDAGRWVVLSLS